MNANPMPFTRPLKRRAVFLLLLAGLPCALWLSRKLWLPLPARFLVVADPLQPAAAIVPLAGETMRLTYSAELFNQGHAQWLAITNVDVDLPGIDQPYYQLARRHLVAQAVPHSQIVPLTAVVETTMGEARALRRLAEDHGWPSLLVITSPYHTRRARHIFRDTFAGSGITIMVRPVPDHWYQPRRWWQDPTGLRVTWDEYLKFALYLAGYRA